MRSVKIERVLCGVIASLLFVLGVTGCSGGIAGTGTGGGSGSGGAENADNSFIDSDSAEWTETASYDGGFSNFIPDEGVRLACASVPRIGQSSDTYYLYHSAELDSGGASHFATSSDGFQFGVSQVAPTRIVDDGSDKPPIETDRTGFSEIVPLVQNEQSSGEGGCRYRIFRHNSALGGFGDGISSECSEDGKWFRAEEGSRLLSMDGGQVGVTTAFNLEGDIHLFSMDGMSPNVMGEYRHRVWHYLSKDGKGDTFTLVSDDPLENGPTIEARDRHNDPMSYALDNGDVVILTMKQHNGPIQPPNVVTGEIYGSMVLPAFPSVVQALSPRGGDRGDTLISVEDFVAAGHDVYSINDPSMIQLADGSYRLYVGALVNVDHYASEVDLSACQQDMSGGNYAWVILSASSIQPVPVVGGGY